MNMAEIDFDKMDAILAKRNPKRNRIAMDNAIMNPEVANRIASGEPIYKIAEDLGVSEISIRKRLKRANMKELVEIENRRILMHLHGRDLSKEKYLSLATSAARFMDSMARQEENDLARENRVISQTYIEELNILLQRPEGERESIRDMGDAERITEEGIRAVRKEIGSGEQEEVREPDESGGTEQER